MNTHTQNTLNRQHAEQLPDRKAMSTIDPTGADAQTSAVTPHDGVHAFVSLQGNGADNGTSMHASGVAEDIPASLSTSASSPNTDDLAGSLSVALRADDIHLDVSAVSLSR
ncbi:MAG: hypothetical protein H7323_03120 [Frankiales bacterium]|nr:hypothetical protein [Frankiales bacterium]